MCGILLYCFQLKEGDNQAEWIFMSPIFIADTDFENKAIELGWMVKINCSPFPEQLRQVKFCFLTWAIQRKDNILDAYSQ